MRNIEVVELLLDKGAKVSAVDKVKHLCREKTLWKALGRLTYIFAGLKGVWFYFLEGEFTCGAVCVAFWCYDIFLAVLIADSVLIIEAVLDFPSVAHTSYGELPLITI